MALYSTLAIRMRADGTELQRSGFTYLLHKSNAEWKIHEIIATDLDSSSAPIERYSQSHITHQWEPSDMGEGWRCRACNQCPELPNF